MTLNDIINGPEGWISEAFEAVVESARCPKGDHTFGTLHDVQNPNVKIKFVAWSRDISNSAGHTMSFAGKGMKKDQDRDGQSQLSFSEKSIINWIAGDIPQQNGTSKAVQGPSGTIMGVTAGMGLNNATELILGIYTPDQIKKKLKDGTFGDVLNRIALFYAESSAWLERQTLTPVEAPEDVAEEEEEDELPF